jgi:hypothetical protein
MLQKASKYQVLVKDDPGAFTKRRLSWENSMEK